MCSQCLYVLIVCALVVVFVINICFMSFVVMSNYLPLTLFLLYVLCLKISLLKDRRTLKQQDVVNYLEQLKIYKQQLNQVKENLTNGRNEVKENFYE